MAKQVTLAENRAEDKFNVKKNAAKRMDFYWKHSMQGFFPARVSAVLKPLWN